MLRLRSLRGNRSDKGLISLGPGSRKEARGREGGAAEERVGLQVGLGGTRRRAVYDSVKQLERLGSIKLHQRSLMGSGPARSGLLRPGPARPGRLLLLSASLQVHILCAVTRLTRLERSFRFSFLSIT
jgi:hypothetical protein